MGRRNDCAIQLRIIYEMVLSGIVSVAMSLIAIGEDRIEEEREKKER